MERSLENARPAVTYYGVFREEGVGAVNAKGEIHKRVLTELDMKVFQHWDDMASSPAKTRPKAQTDQSVEGLTLLSCTAAGPVWPATLTGKFPAESAEHKELMELKQTFEKEFPPQVEGGGAPTVRKTMRVTGQPDFSIDGGREPIDLARVVDLCAEALPGPDERRAGVG